MESYCFKLEDNSFRKSRGSITIRTDQRARKYTFSTRILEFVVSAIETGVSVYVEVGLPSETVPVTLVPPPEHMISGAGTRLYYEGSKQFGKVRRTKDGKGRAISQTVGGKITYQDPKLEKSKEFW